MRYIKATAQEQVTLLCPETFLELAATAIFPRFNCFVYIRVKLLLWCPESVDQRRVAPRSVSTRGPSNIDLLVQGLLYFNISWSISIAFPSPPFHTERRDIGLPHAWICFQFSDLQTIQTVYFNLQNCTEGELLIMDLMDAR